MTGENYELFSYSGRIAFLFNSEGPKGVIAKIVLFEHLGGKYYNLAFGDLENYNLNDRVISNNADTRKVISTIFKAINIFFEFHPNAVVQINPVDEKREKLYNFILKNRFDEIDQNYLVKGIAGRKKENYNSKKMYERFEISKKHLMFQI
jgi:hypothetical protein